MSQAWSLSAAVLVALAALSQAAVARADMAPLPPDLIALDSPEGENLLIESKARRDYFKLSETFVTQKEQSLCPAASAVMVLNALQIAAPATPGWDPYRTFTQDNLFNDQARALGVARGGLQLEQLKALLETYPVDVIVVHAGTDSLENFRRTVAKDLAEPDGFVIVNFLRSALDEDPKGPIESKLAGHFSPIAAYNEKSDRFLMLDVARYKYPPAWIPAKMLFDAMNTTDADSGKTRGYLLVRASEGAKVAPTVVHQRSRLLIFAIVTPLFLLSLGAYLGAWLQRRAHRKAAPPALA